MLSKRSSEQFKIEAVNQIVDRTHSTSSIATRPDMTTQSLYACPQQQVNQEARMSTGYWI